MVLVPPDLQVQQQLSDNEQGTDMRPRCPLQTESVLCGLRLEFDQGVKQHLFDTQTFGAEQGWPDTRLDWQTGLKIIFTSSVQRKLAKGA